MKRYLFASLLTLAAVLGTACEYQHPNGCIELVDEDLTGKDYGTFTDGQSPLVGQWTNTDLTPFGYAQQEDGRIYKTPACARSMPVY